MFFGIRVTDLWENKDRVIQWIEEYWSDYFYVMEKSSKGVEHYHILVEDTVSRDAIRKRIKLLWSGNRQYNLKELDEQRVNLEYIPYMCKDVVKSKKNLYGRKGSFKQFSIKEMRNKFNLVAKEYKNGVLGKIQCFIDAQEKYQQYKPSGAKEYCVEIVYYYVNNGLCMPSRFRCMSLAETMAARAYGGDYIRSMVDQWFE